MLRIVLAAIVMSVTTIGASPALAQEASAVLSTATTDVGTLLDTPAAKAIVDKHLPGFLDNPQIGMARSMTLRQLQAYAGDTLKDETLAMIDADLAKLKK